MKSKRKSETQEPAGGARRKKYIKPEIISSSAEELLEQLGTARACSFHGSVVTCGGEQMSSGEVNKE